MKDLKEFKCPACGGPLAFDSGLQKMKCPYCDSVYDMAQFSDDAQEEKRKEEKKQTHWQEDETHGMRVYTCQSCGGEVLADAVTAAKSCPYCGNNVMMESQFEGGLRPDFVLPFSVTKETAVAALKKHIRGYRFHPKAFTLERTLQEVKGIYVPFWLFDADTDFYLEYEGRRLSRVWSSGDYDYKEFEYYSIQKGGAVHFHGVPVDASTKMNDTMMDALEPFDLNQMTDFNPGYLAGFFADRYDVSEQESTGRADARARQAVLDCMGGSIHGFDAVTYKGGDIHMHNRTVKYALLPVWYMTVRWNDQLWHYAVNGRNGRTIGEIPFDKGRYWRFFLKQGLIYTPVMIVLINIIMYLLL